MYVVVTPPNVELGEEGTSRKSIDYGRDEGGYVSVLFCPFIEWAVVLYWSELAILLFDKEEVGRVWTP